MKYIVTVRMDMYKEGRVEVDASSRDAAVEKVDDMISSRKLKHSDIEDWDAPVTDYGTFARTGDAEADPGTEHIVDCVAIGYFAGEPVIRPVRVGCSNPQLRGGLHLVTARREIKKLRGLVEPIVIITAAHQSFQELDKFNWDYVDTVLCEE